MGARETLRNYLMEGIVADLFTAEQTCALLKQIGQNAGPINQANFGALFGPLQSVLTHSYFLSVAKLFERPDRKYPNRSIPSVLQLMERSSKDLLVTQRQVMFKRLASVGMNISLLWEKSDSEITLEVVRYFGESLPSAGLATSCGMSKALHAVVTRRDKVVAHNEMIDHASLPQTTWLEIEQLILYAKGFIDVVGIGYINTAFACDDGHFFLSQDANMAANALRRLLMKGVLLNS